MTHLARLFLRAWQLRLGAVLVASMCAVLIVGSAVADSLQLSPDQRADATLGTYAYRMQIPGSAALGVDGAALDKQITTALEDEGAGRAEVSYVASGLTPDGDESRGEYVVEEVSDIEAMSSRLSVTRGALTSRPGTALVTEAVADLWPVGTDVSFFNGRLVLRVTGVVRDEFNHSSRSFVVASGQWASIDAGPLNTAGGSAEAANRVVYWDGPISQQSATAIILDVLERSNLDIDSPQSGAVESRSEISASPSPRNGVLEVALVAVPLLTGSVAGALVAYFTGRARRILWAVGVSRQDTRTATIAAVSAAASLAGLIGTLLGIGAAFAIRPILAEVATQQLGPIVTWWPWAVSAPLAIITASIVASRSGAADRPQEPSADSRDQVNRLLIRFAAAVALIGLGTFVGAGTNDVAIMAIAAFIYAVAVLVVATPPLVTAVGWTRVDSIPVRLATRKFSLEHRRSSAAVFALATLQVLGAVVAIIVTSSVAQLNASTESQVAPGQVAFAPTVDDGDALSQLRTDWEIESGLPEALQIYTVGAGTERADGPTRTLASITDIEQYLGATLDPGQEATLLSDGALLMKSPDASSATFAAEKQITIATTMGPDDLDPSFRNISAVMLTEAARSAGLPVLSPMYVYPGLTDVQVAEAHETANALGISADWVQSYRPPDVFEAPLRASMISAVLGLLAGIVLLIQTSSQAHEMRPVLSGLRAVGVGPGLLASAIAARVGMTVALSITLGAVAASIGVGGAFAAAGVNLGVTFPLIPMIAMGAVFAVCAAIAATVATRRLKTAEWIR